TKGGAGKSVLASNLGVLLAQRAEGTVALVDADLQFGDIAVMLKLAPQHTIV
ncbi:MAG: P-loop NTPase, partial [Acidimicrobiales bacterium]|nr:P-loop NTPase [Acidimicrobiales bacterium]